jgi:hypothetical protein
MRVIIGYESMYGSTRAVADAIANGFPLDDDVTVRPVQDLDVAAVDADVLVIGAPTHVHGLPSARSRTAAHDLSRAVTRPDQRLEPDAGGPGVREWLDRLPSTIDAQVAAFDTRLAIPGWISGRAGRRITRRLHDHSAQVLAPPASFIVGREGRLRPGELDRARRWGEQLAELAHQREPTATRQLDAQALWHERDHLEPLIGVPSVSAAPAPLPDTASYEPEPGLAPEQEERRRG